MEVMVRNWLAWVPLFMEVVLYHAELEKCGVDLPPAAGLRDKEGCWISSIGDATGTWGTGRGRLRECASWGCTDCAVVRCKGTSTWRWGWTQDLWSRKGALLLLGVVMDTSRLKTDCFCCWEHCSRSLLVMLMFCPEKGRGLASWDWAAQKQIILVDA